MYFVNDYVHALAMFGQQNQFSYICLPSVVVSWALFYVIKRWIDSQSAALQTQLYDIQRRCSSPLSWAGRCVGGGPHLSNDV